MIELERPAMQIAQINRNAVGTEIDRYLALVIPPALPREGRRCGEHRRISPCRPKAGFGHHYRRHWDPLLCPWRRMSNLKQAPRRRTQATNSATLPIAPWRARRRTA